MTSEAKLLCFLTGERVNRQTHCDSAGRLRGHWAPMGAPWTWMRFLVAVLLSVLTLPACTNDDGPNGICREDSTELFDRRVAPILVEDRPSTCNQCHLSGVDLSLFVRDTPCETMSCLVQLELVDLESPDDSLILHWIDRAMPDSALITEQVISAEHEAFREWIVHTAECGGLDACGGVDCGPAEPGNQCEVREGSDAPPFELDPSDCSSIAREDAFLHEVYPYRGRCFPCHFIGSEYGPPEAPRWIDGSDVCGASSLASMNNLLELGVVDFDDPEMSLLLLKPLAEDQGGVVHGGHDKFADKDDMAYVSFLEWIRYEAGCR